MLKGLNGYVVVGIGLWLILFIYALFPKNKPINWLIYWVGKIFFEGGSRQRW